MKRNLDQKYPQLFYKPVAIECGDGWLDLIDQTLGQIDSYLKKSNESATLFPKTKKPIEPVKILQIKEKWGVLTIYFTGGDEVVRNLIALSQKISQHTCEITGNKGQLMIKNLYYKTLSPEQADLQGFKLIEGKNE